MIVLVTLLVIFLTYLAFLGTRRYQKIQLLEKIPGAKAYPIVGNSLQFTGSHQHMFKMFRQFCDYEGGISKFYMGPESFILLYQGNTVEKILGSNHMIVKSKLYRQIQPWLGTGLLTSKGDKWRSRRKLLTPTFHFKILEDYIEVFNKNSITLVKKLEENCDGSEHNIKSKLELCALDTIMETAMGNKTNFQNDPECEYVKAVNRLLELVHTRNFTPWLHPDILFKLSGYEKIQNDCLKVLHGASMTAIKNRREFTAQETKINHQQPNMGIKKRLAFMDLLINDSECLTDESIREEVDTFMFAGLDTLSTTLNFTLFWLAKHPDVQDKAYQEVCSLVGGVEFISMNHLSSLKYLEACIKESLRITPPVPLVGREITEEIDIAGYQIPVGVIALVNFYELHRDPKEFPNPEVYDPDRFTNLEEVSKRHPYCYAPFSAGPRNCIGQKFAMMELKIILANLIKNFKMSTKQTYEDLGLVADLVLTPKNGIHMKMERRES